MSRSIYILGSLRNQDIPTLGQMLRDKGHDVFDDWHGAGPEADDYWQKYEKSRGHNYREALAGLAAGNVFAFDRKHMDRCDTGILVMPAGKSAHLELGFMIGQGKEGYVLFNKEPERWDVMYKFANGVYFNMEDLIKAL